MLKVWLVFLKFDQISKYVLSISSSLEVFKSQRDFSISSEISLSVSVLKILSSPSMKMLVQAQGDYNIEVKICKNKPRRIL